MLQTRRPTPATRCVTSTITLTPSVSYSHPDTAGSLRSTFCPPCPDLVPLVRSSLPRRSLPLLSPAHCAPTRTSLLALAVGRTARSLP